MEEKSSVWYEQHLKLKLAITNQDVGIALVEGIKAYELDKTKRESLYEVIKMLREHAWSSVAYILCLKVLEIPYPKNDNYEGFDKNVYSFLCQYEMSIVAFYGNNLNLGLQCSSDLLLNPDATEHVKTNVRNNLKFYMNPLFNCKHQELIYPEKKKGWNLFNPSICLFNNDIIVNGRLANSGGLWFHLNPEIGGYPVSSEHPIVTENVRSKLYSDDWKMFHCNNKLQTCSGAWVKGLEDCKLFTFENDLWFLATAKEYTNNFVCKTLIGHRNKLTLLKGPDPNRNEKNWLPFQFQDKILAIYSYQPFTILQLNADTGDCDTFLMEEYPHLNLSSFRGSAPPIYIQNAWYFIVHEVIGSLHRLYYHRIVKMDDEFQLTHISLPFRMLGKNDIEYVNGMCEKDGIIYISYGDNDNKAMIATMDFNDFEKLCLVL